MDLSSEDALRLQVLVTSAEAVRIDESAMVVHGLQGDREMRVSLNPTCNDDKYLKIVRQMLSGTVLGSPGGYPVFLRRWTRTGEITSAHLDKLLMLGEPEAVLAVARAPKLTDDIARKAWWAGMNTEVGRCMLENPAVVETAVGREIAEYLVEYLPFETEHRDMLETVGLVLQRGLLSEERKERLWNGGRLKATYRIGFLNSCPEDLPERVPARPDLARYAPELSRLAAEGNRYAELLLRVLGEPGQSFLATAADIIRRPADQDVVSEWLNAVGRYFGAVRQSGEERRELAAIFTEVEALCGVNGPEPVRALLAAVPELVEEVRSMLVLAHVDEAVVTPIFALTDAVGTVMRKKAEPVTGAILEMFAVLRNG